MATPGGQSAKRRPKHQWRIGDDGSGPCIVCRAWTRVCREARESPRVEFRQRGEREWQREVPDCKAGVERPELQMPQLRLVGC